MNPKANPPHYPFQEEPFEWHPYAQIFPMMSEEELEELAADIESNGLVNPIQLYDGKILDGRNRYAAMERLNHRRLVEDKPLMPVTYGTFLQEVTPANDARALAFVKSHNLSRRNLTTSQRAAIALEFERYYAEIAKRELVWRNERRNVEQSTDPMVVNSQPGGLENKSAYKAAKDLGVGQQSVSRAKTIQQSSPELFQEVLEGKTTVNAAYNQIKPKPKKEPEFLPEEDSDPQTLEITSEEIILSFVSNIESLFPDELQYCLGEVYNRRREAILEFVAKLRITDPQLFTEETANV